MTSVACCNDAQSVASASAAGSVHVWRVEYTARPGGAPDRYTGVTSRRQVGSDMGLERKAVRISHGRVGHVFL